MNDPEIQGKTEKGGRGKLKQDMEGNVQNKEHPGPLRTARRGHYPGHQGQSKAMNQTSHREQGSEARQTNTGLECINAGEQSRAEGPSPEQWAGNRGAKLASRKTEAKQQWQASTSYTGLLWFHSYRSPPERAAQGRGAGVHSMQPSDGAWRGQREPAALAHRFWLPMFFSLGLVSRGYLFPTLSIYWRQNDENAAEFTKLS